MVKVYFKGDYEKPHKFMKKVGYSWSMEKARERTEVGDKKGYDSVIVPATANTGRKGFILFGRKR